MKIVKATIFQCDDGIKAIKNNNSNQVNRIVSNIFKVIEQFKDKTFCIKELYQNVPIDRC